MVTVVGSNGDGTSHLRSQSAWRIPVSVFVDKKYDNQPKIGANHYTKSAYSVSLSFLEASGKLGHNVGFK
jgi:hypothetical protein